MFPKKSSAVLPGCLNKTISAAAEQPAFDADALLRGIARQAVAEKLDNRMLQETVRETVIPVLEEWLSHYLPKLVAEEVKRVMVKAGGR